MFKHNPKCFFRSKVIKGLVQLQSSSKILCCVVFVFHKRFLQHLLVCVSAVSAPERDEIKRKSVKEGNLSL